MPSCCVKICKNNNVNSTEAEDEEVTFHKFPTNDEKCNQAWIEIIRKSRGDANWTPFKSSVVCSVHFDRDDFCFDTQGIIGLKTNAVPKQFLFESSSEVPGISLLQCIPLSKQILLESPNVEEELSHIKEQSVDINAEASHNPCTSSPLPKSLTIKKLENGYIHLTRSGLMSIDITPEEQDPLAIDPFISTVHSCTPQTVPEASSSFAHPFHNVSANFTNNSIENVMNQPSITCIIPYKKALKQQEIMYNKQTQELKKLNETIDRLVESNEAMKIRLKLRQQTRTKQKRPKK